jgi:hypothetical protein
LTTTPPSVSRLSGKCGSLDVSQRPVTGIALPFYSPDTDSVLIKLSAKNPRQCFPVRAIFYGILLKLADNKDAEFILILKKQAH